MVIATRKSMASVAAAAALFAASPTSPAVAGGGGGNNPPPPDDTGSLVVDVAADRVTASGYQPGAAELRVTRPDAVTREPVLIGIFTDTVQANVPLTVNTTAPVNGVGGDCWEGPQGSLLGWTPDIRAGDTVTFRGDTVVVAPSAGDDVVGGPVAGCDVVGAQRANAPYARNEVTATSPAAISAATDVVSPLTVSGVAQPFATSVSVTLTDGVTTTPVVSVSPVGGAWSATFGGADVARLADGRITVHALYVVPDLATGVPHPIAGAPAQIVKDTRVVPAPAGTTPAEGGTQQDVVSTSPTATPRASARITGLSTSRAVRLAHARRAGLRVAFLLPDAGRVFAVEVRRGGRATYRRTFRAAPGARQTVRLDARPLRRALRRGTYTVSVRAELGDGRLGPAAGARVRVR